MEESEVDLKQASELARSEMNRRGLQDWAFDMSYTLKTTFGKCRTRKKVITLSALLTNLNTFTEVNDTVQHEIAHALREIERTNVGPTARHFTAGQWHDARWAQIARSLGCNGKQFFSKQEVNIGRTVRPTKNIWKVTCPNCQASGTTMKRSTKNCCGKCYRETGTYHHYVYTPNK
jgi:hypothetical protein